MKELRARAMLSLDGPAEAALIVGARDKERVRGLTHGYYNTLPALARFLPAPRLKRSHVLATW